MLEGLSTIAHAYVGATEHDARPHSHAIALAAAAKAKLVSVHAATSAHDDPAPGRPAHERLAAWGRADEPLEEEVVVHRCCDDPVDTVLDALKRVKPDLVVVGTEQRRGWQRIFGESRAEVLTANLDVPVLVVPRTAKGFVGSHGELELTRVIIPCGDRQSARAALDHALALVESAGVAEVVTFLLLHVGDGEPPDLDHPASVRVRIEREHLDGDIDRTLAEAADGASLVVMATRGHDSLYDELMGSHTERVMRLVHVPLLSVPLR
ncbi:MAG: universal stress protein [Sandaracinaceae bacterium]|nr:universal stress protein [Sandaracinaceae bacterium]